MGNTATFFVENDCESVPAVHVEPEGLVVALESKEKILVHDDYKESPVTLVVSEIEVGERVLSIWPGDGNTIVTKNGKDVLDMS